jgi:antitoxin YefM
MTYQLNTSELGSGFIDSLRGAYPDREVVVTVRERDETEYLASSPANKEHLDKAIENIRQGKNLISFETLEQAIQCAEEQTTANVS